MIMLHVSHSHVHVLPVRWYTHETMNTSGDSIIRPRLRLQTRESSYRPSCADQRVTCSRGDCQVCSRPSVPQFSGSSSNHSNSDYTETVVLLQHRVPNPTNMSEKKAVCAVCVCGNQAQTAGPPPTRHNCHQQKCIDSPTLHPAAARQPPPEYLDSEPRHCASTCTSPLTNKASALGCTTPVRSTGCRSTMLRA